MNWLKRIFGGGAANQDTTKAPLPDFPFPLVAVSGAKAEREWRRLNAAWRREGASAVLVGDAEQVARMAEAAGGPESGPDLIAAGERLSPAAYFARREQECGAAGVVPDQDAWPTGRIAASTLGAHLEILSRKPKPLVYLARIPTTRAWEIPALLKFGGWNDCPSPSEQVTVLQYWSERHGLEIYAITGDLMECTVAQPPRTQAAALTLAREQFLFCTDIVYQGTESIAVLGATLQDSPVWYFWWD